MKQQTILTIAIALTAFVMLAIEGAIITSQVAQAKANAAAQAQASISQDVPSTQYQDTQPAQQDYQPLLTQIANREAQYQALINQANAQLIQAEKDEKALEDQVTTLKSANAQLASSAAAQAAQPAVVTPQQASQAAASYMHEKDLYAVESVSYYGSTAYKVTFSSGATVFVSTYGQIMLALSASSGSTSSGSSGGGGGGGSGSHYSDGGGHDD